MVIKFTYLKTPINKMTFKSKKIRDWVEAICEGRTLNLFAGETLLNIDEVRNDIRPSMQAHFHLDALDCLKWHEKNTFDTILLDPPYSHRKSMEMYEGKRMSPFNAMKPEIDRVLRPGGIVLTFGYHTVTMGAKRGFVVEHICIMSHGGAIHDTIAAVERKQYVD